MAWQDTSKDLQSTFIILKSFFSCCRKAVKKGFEFSLMVVGESGFEFSLMVVGESGLGKSTLINSMFLTDIYQSTANSSSQASGPKLPQTLDIQAQKVKLVENDVHLTLTVVDTPGNFLSDFLKTNETEVMSQLLWFCPTLLRLFLVPFMKSMKSTSTLQYLINV